LGKRGVAKSNSVPIRLVDNSSLAIYDQSLWIDLNFLPPCPSSSNFFPMTLLVQSIWKLSAGPVASFVPSAITKANRIVFPLDLQLFCDAASAT